MTARFSRHIDLLPPLKDDSRGILYQCRMQYLKSREGGSRSKTRRRGHGVLTGIQEQQFSCLDERVHGPCSSEILLPPDELMTRSKAFRFAYWQHHRDPIMKSIKKIQIGFDGTCRTERLKKRREILSRIEATNRARKESELLRRAERVMDDSLDIDGDSESDSEIILSSSNSEQRSLRGNVLPQLPSQDGSNVMSPLSTSSDRGKGVKAEQNDVLPQLKRVTMTKRDLTPKGKANSDDSAFSFLSDWSKKDKQKVRW